MKFVLFDTILERHLCESLKRALENEGHEVIYTDLIVHGHSMISEKRDIEKVWAQIHHIASYSPDVLVSFRPMNLTPEMLEYLKSRMLLCIWLSDDPVLYKLSYGQVVDYYDIILHCGSEKVLEFYEAKGHEPGFNFPFWTDNVAFPKVFDPINASTDVVFLGNMHGQVRHKRYLELGQLDCRKAVYGLVDADPLAQNGGFISDGYINTTKVTEVLRTAKVGLSIPQFFKDYKGLENDFEGLAELGYFQFPSRVIQYIASGLPVLAVGDELMKEACPSLIVENSVVNLIPHLEKLLGDNDFIYEVAKNTYLDFQHYFSASVRAKMLIDLVENLGERKQLSCKRRALLFKEY